MAGHNKWSKIKHKKAGTDAKKSALFGKMARALAAKSRQCGGDRSDPALKSEIERAKAMSMPAENIERAVKKGMSGEAERTERVTYETYGPGGCAILIRTSTDNRNRTAAEVRHILARNGYNIGAPGSAAWVFTEKDDRIVPSATASLSEDDEKKLAALVEDLMSHADIREIHTNKA